MIRERTLLYAILAATVLCFSACRIDADCPDLSIVDDSCAAKGTPYTFEVPYRFPLYKIPEDNPTTVQGIRLGRILFYDENLSESGNMSCATCHSQTHSFADPRPFSINEFGVATKRNSPALINELWMSHVFWDGRAASLEEQAADAFVNEQNINYKEALAYIKSDTEMVRLFNEAFGCNQINETNMAKAVAQFVRSIISSDSKFDRWLKGTESLTAEEMNGFTILTTESGNCFHCHFGSPLLTSSSTQFSPYIGFHNNGLDTFVDYHDLQDFGLGQTTADDNHMGVFKAPTLRNLVFTAPYMHDSRFSNLDQVLDFYSDSVKLSPTVDIFIRQFPGGVHLSPSDKADLMAFLMTFTDSSVVTNPEYSDPRP